MGSPLYFAAVVTFFFLFFLAYSQQSEIGCLPYFHTWCGLSANLECRSEMCCTRLTENTGCVRHHTTLSGYIFATKHVLTIGKNVKLQYLLHMSSQYGELQPISGWDRFGSLGHPQQISIGFTSWLHYCTDVTQWRSTKLCTMFGRRLGWYTIYTFLGAFAPWRNFATCIHFAAKSCVLLYWKYYWMALEQWASAKLCGVVRGMELGTLAEGATYIRQGGHHVGHRPTF